MKDKNDLLNAYIKRNPQKIVKNLDLEKNKIEYDLIKQHRKMTELTPEECCRAFLLTKLVNELGYPADKIEIEREYTAGRPHTNTSRIDIIVRDSKDDVFLFIEAKNSDEYATIDKDKYIEEQLFKVAGMERTEGHNVKYLVLYTANFSDSINEECMIIDSCNFSTFQDWKESREYNDTIPAHYEKAQKTPYVKKSLKDLETKFTPEMLKRLQSDLHNVLWGGGSTDDNDVFSSLTNLILSKIQDEDETEDGDTYDFQSLTFEKDGDEAFETNEQLFVRINDLYRRALKSKLYILDEVELKKSYVIDTKKFSLSKLKYAVQKLEGLSFIDGKNSLNGKDILGDFFEGIIRSGFKQSKGQFFTHTNIVRFMLYALQTDKLTIKRIKDDKEIPYMIDPSAGSGTFLIEYMRFITHIVKYCNRNSDGYNSNLGTARGVADKIKSDWFYPDNRENKWAQTYIYGSEINFNLGTATKVNMILHGDGSTNIFVKDGLLPFSKYKKETAPNILNNSQTDPCYYINKDKPLNINGQFDLILTNPPFSVELDNDTKKSIKTNFIFGEKKNSENLFIERWYQLLRENGRLAAVLPESVFDTTENKYIRLFLFKYFKVKAIISLPQLSFEPYTSTKTSIIFAQKKTKKEIANWDNTWIEASKKWQENKTIVKNLISVCEGKKKKEKLPSIRDLTKKQEKEIIREMLVHSLTLKDKDLSADDLIRKYRYEIDNICKIDKDTQDSLGFVNTWWVFGEVTKKINYDIFMAEVDNIGYKRYTKNKVVVEKPMPNELFRSKNGEIIVDDEQLDTVLDYMRVISWD